MTMRTFSVILLLVVVILGLSLGDLSAKAEQQEKIALRILYAGTPGSMREKDWLGFLKKHFTKVASADLKGFTGKESSDFDVLILDSDYSGRRAFSAPRPSLVKDYSRPTVTVGAVGAMICDGMRLKTGYL